MPERAAVLFVVSEYGEFLHLLDLALRIHDVANIHPVFLFKADYGALERHRQMVQGRGFSWVSEKDVNDRFDLSQTEAVLDDYVPTSLGAATLPQRRHNRVRRKGKWHKRLARRSTDMVVAGLGILLLPFYLAYRLVRPLGRARTRVLGQRICADNLVGSRVESMERVFAIFDPKLVIAGQDYPLSATAVAAKIGEDRGVRTAIVPFSMTPTTKEIAESFAELGINRVRTQLYRRMIAHFGQRWLHRYRGRNYTRLRLLQIIMSELHGLTPPQPWTPNSGRGIILAPSQQSIDYCLSAGIPAEQLKLTGALWNDQLLQRLPGRDDRRARLIREIKLANNYWRYMRSLRDKDTGASDDRKLVIVCWPPNQWPRKASGFPTYEAFSQALTDTLASIMHSGYVDIAISLHPTLVGTPLADAVSASGLYVIGSDLIDVLDCADVFVATVSSTLLWSLQLGIPSINFDPYRYQYREFSQAGMLEAGNLHQLGHQLMSLIVEETSYKTTRERMLAARDYWTTQDGLSGERILEQLRSLLELAPDRQPNPRTQGVAEQTRQGH